MKTVLVQALQKLGKKSWDGMLEEESLEATENRHKGCRHDMLGAFCSKQGQQQQGRPDRRRRTGKQTIEGSKPPSEWQHQSNSTYNLSLAESC